MSDPLSRPFSRYAAWGSFAAWTVLVFILSSIRGDDLSAIPIEFIGLDKIAHIVLFLIGGFTLTAALRLTFRWPATLIFLAAFLYLACFGVCDEIRQLFTPNRSGADVYDWLADAVGAVIGSLAFLILYGITPLRRLVAAHAVPEEGN